MQIWCVQCSINVDINTKVWNNCACDMKNGNHEVDEDNDDNKNGKKCVHMHSTVANINTWDT